MFETNRILNLLHGWLGEYGYLAYIDPQTEVEELRVEREEITQVCRQVLEFLQTDLTCHPHKQIRSWAGPLKNTLQRIFTFNRLSYPSGQPIPSPTLPPSSSPPSPSLTAMAGADALPALNDPKQWKQEQLRKREKRTKAELLQLNPEELFRQLTLVEFGMFADIRPLDLIYKSRSRLDKAPHLKAIIDRFNHVSYWIATEICMCRDLKKRTEVLKHFIKVAKLCFKWNNFNTWYVFKILPSHF